MTHVPHELVEDFPAEAERIHRLKAGNPHFARLAEEYHDLNRQVHRSETNVEPMDEMAEQTLRKRRMMLKDELGRMLAETD
jgi:hypothetical protein